MSTVLLWGACWALMWLFYMIPCLYSSSSIGCKESLCLCYALIFALCIIHGRYHNTIHICHSQRCTCIHYLDCCLLLAHTNHDMIEQWKDSKWINIYKLTDVYAFEWLSKHWFGYHKFQLREGNDGRLTPQPGEQIPKLVSDALFSNQVQI